MTWLGNPDAKPTDTKRDAMLKKREGLVEKLKQLKDKGPAGRMAHHVRFHQEDMTKLAKEITSIDSKLGRPVDRNSGG